MPTTSWHRSGPWRAPGTWSSTVRWITRASISRCWRCAWDEERAVALLTGWGRGYASNGVLGALLFARVHAPDYAGCVNLLVEPFVRPWGYARIHRWNPEAADPTRSFRQPSPARESA